MQDGGRVLANYFTILGVGIFRSCSCPRRSGRVFPVSFQQGKCYCLFCNFLSQYEWMALKVQSPENRLSCIFQAKANIYLFISIAFIGTWESPKKGTRTLKPKDFVFYMGNLPLDQNTLSVL